MLPQLVVWIHPISLIVEVLEADHPVVQVPGAIAEDLCAIAQTRQQGQEGQSRDLRHRVSPKCMQYSAAEGANWALDVRGLRKKGLKQEVFIFRRSLSGRSRSFLSQTHLAHPYSQVSECQAHVLSEKPDLVLLVSCTYRQVPFRPNHESIID